MSNQIHHNKWHGFNHHTQPTLGFPDSSTDPIASFNYPFGGVFYNILENKTLKAGKVTISSTGSGYNTPPDLFLSFRGTRGNIIKQGNFKANLNTALKTITSVDIIDGGNYTGSVFLTAFPKNGDVIIKTAVFGVSSIPYTFGSNSQDWWFYSSLTKNNSADWNLWGSVEQTVTLLFDNWQLGYEGYTTLIANSSNFESVYNTTRNLSSEKNYDGLGGTGWHIALSSITHRLNTSAINTKQKVAIPVRVYDKDNTITWFTTAQTVYYNVTGNYTLTAKDIFEAKKGGKYTMWLYIDRCPQEKANVVFHPDTYNISVKTPESTFQSSHNVLILSARHITRVDFVYDGVKMLGRATDYFMDLPTTFDIYYRGSGIFFRDPSNNRRKNPVYVNALTASNKAEDIYLDRGNGTLIDILNLTQYPVTSSLYVAGSGIKMRFLGADQQYFNFNLYNATWPSVNHITKFPLLTSSFDRVIGLSAGSWLDRAYGNNLLATPVSGDAPVQIIQKFPEPYYSLGPSNIITLKQCTSSYTIEVYSGKDRFIDNLILNESVVSKVPIKFNNKSQPFNFLNEETAVLKFERIQEDQDIEVYYSTQPTAIISNNILWFNSMDDTLFKPNTINVDEWVSNTNYDYKLKQLDVNSRPALTVDGSLRGVYLKNNDFLTLNTPLTSLSSANLFRTPFSTIAVVEFDSFPATSFLWWLGDFSDRGYGLMMRGNKMYTGIGDTPRDVINNFIFETGKKYVITTVFNNNKDKIFINNRTATRLNPRSFTNDVPVLEDYKFTLGKNPNATSGYSDLKLYEFAFFKKALTIPEINRLNQFYIEKINGYK